MKLRGWLTALLVGGGAWLSVTAMYQAWKAAEAETQDIALVHVGIWVPLVPMLLAALGLTLWFLAAIFYVVHRRSSRATPPSPESEAPSPFAVDPWHDTAPLGGLAAHGSSKERIAALMTLARDLEARGRLRAAGEMYRQVYEVARADASLSPQAREALVAWRKVERRLLARGQPWWRRWLRAPALEK